MSRKLLHLAEARPEELEGRLERCPALVLPVGTVEYHGHHLPLGLDGLKAEAIALHAAGRSGALVAPTSWWAADGVPKRFTLRLSADLLEPLLEEALRQFLAMGFRVIVIVNGHFGLANSRLVRRVALSAMRHGPGVVIPVADYETLLDVGNEGDHAGRWETSLLLGTRPDLVDLGRVTADGPVDGVLGEPPHASNDEEGRMGIALAGDRIAARLERALRFDHADREAFVAALAAGLEALDVLAQLRSELPRERVPPVLTPSWSGHLQALERDDFDEALRWAEQKSTDPAS